MVLMLVYTLLCIVAETVATFIGWELEKALPTAALTIYLVMFFAILVVMWPLAIRLTARFDPENVAEESGAAKKA